ncbi:MAG: PQQ-binding-like beta-propeller repeat protein [Halobacteriales archaeon]|nr:PQQ-binding-like beta-propeller repeat protein [Halobacteriales archaeon]
MEAAQRSVLFALALLLSPGLAAALPEPPPAPSPGLPLALWSASLGDGEGLGIAPALQGGAFVIGTSPDGALLAKLGPDGAPVWGASEHDAAWLGIAALVDGSPVVAGADQRGARPAPLLALYDSDGALQWRRDLPAPGALRAVAAGPQGIIAAGDAGMDVLVARYAADGTLRWKRTLGGVLEDHGASVALAPDDSAYVAGWSYDGVRNRLLAWHLDPDGKVLWSRVLTWPSGSIRAYGASVDAQGNLLVAGAVANGALNLPFLARFTPAGAQAWLRTYPALEGPGASGVAADALGGAVLVGTAAPGHGFVLRVAATGDSVWIQRFDAGESSAANAVARDALGVLVAGTAQGQGTVERALDLPARPA